MVNIDNQHLYLTLVIIDPIHAQPTVGLMKVLKYVIRRHVDERVSKGETFGT